MHFAADPIRAEANCSAIRVRGAPVAIFTRSASILRAQARRVVFALRCYEIHHPVAFAFN